MQDFRGTLRRIRHFVRRKDKMPYNFAGLTNIRIKINKLSVGIFIATKTKYQSDYHGCP